MGQALKCEASFPKIETKETEFAWAAGFFDGEGCVRFRNGERGGTFTLQIAQVHREPLDRFCVAVSVGKVYGPYKARSATRKPYYAYFAFGLPAKGAFEKMRPYLSSIKRVEGDDHLKTYLDQVSRHKYPKERISEIIAAFDRHVDPNVGKILRNGKRLTKHVSFGRKHASEYGMTCAGLANLVRRRDRQATGVAQ